MIKRLLTTCFLGLMVLFAVFAGSAVFAMPPGGNICVLFPELCVGGVTPTGGVGGHPGKSEAELLQRVSGGASEYQVLYGIGGITVDDINWYYATAEVLTKGAGITDLAISKEPSEASAERNDILDFTIKVKNQATPSPGSQSAIVNAVFIDTLSKGLSLISEGTTPGYSQTSDPATGFTILTWPLDAFAPGQQEREFKVRAKVNIYASGNQFNLAEVWKVGENLANNSEKGFKITIKDRDGNDINANGDANNRAVSLISVPEYAVFEGDHWDLEKSDEKQFVRVDSENTYSIKATLLGSTAIGKKYLNIAKFSVDGAVYKNAYGDVLILPGVPKIFLRDILPSNAEYKGYTISGCPSPTSVTQPAVGSKSGKIEWYWNAMEVGTTCNITVTVKIPADLTRQAPAGNALTEIKNTFTAFGGEGDNLAFCPSLGGDNEPCRITDISYVMAPFPQELGGTQGNIYAKGKIMIKKNLPLKDIQNAAYVIGAGGEIEAVSSATWLTKDYGIRTESASQFSPEEAQCYPVDASGNIVDPEIYSTYSQNGYCVMERNRQRLLLSPQTKHFSSVGATATLDKIDFRFSSGETVYPEGKVFHYRGNLDLKPAVGNNKIKIFGKGTIIVDGNLRIYGGLEYSDPSRDVIGFIVGGYVAVQPVVGLWSDDCDDGIGENAALNARGKIVGFYYLPGYNQAVPANQRGMFFSRGDAPDGQFPPGSERMDLNKPHFYKYDNQMYLKGAVVARGFMLNRNFVGIIDKDEKLFCEEIGFTPTEGNPIPPEPTAPGEVFEYDGRIITNPPPGFSNVPLPKME